MLTLPKEAEGPLIAAFVTGFIALIGLIISKEQKVSEFRQAWIDGLRSDIGSFIGHANVIHGANRAVAEGRKPVEAWAEAKDDYFGLNAADSRIRLRLNPAKASDVAIMRTLDEHRKACDSGAYDNLVELHRRLVFESQAKLKTEWQRVKLGEPVYRFVSKVLITAIMGLLIAYFRL
jgi:hypothetical protein